MSESTRVFSQIDEADTEVELSAQDLMALSDSLPIDRSQTDVALQPPQPTTSAPRKLGAPKALANRESRLAAAIIVTVSIAGVGHVLKPSEHASQSMAKTSQPTTAPAQLSQDEPVRFANPFDAKEVFEFPPGTTETEARDAVAAVLLERAMSRQKT